jgi:hypothetical protein
LGSSSGLPARKLLLPWLYFAALLAANLYICREAFVTESTGHFNSIHGQWMALARLQGLHWLAPHWWPYWGAGSPLESTYAPIVPFTIATFTRLFRESPALALNQLTALVYCLGPLVLYLVSWRASRAPGYSFAAALAYALLSPAGLIIPDHGFHFPALWSARRLYLIFEWDDLAHLASFTLFPIAAWFLARALRSRRTFDYAIAGISMVGMMLANMFGAVLSALVVFTVPLALGGQPHAGTERRFQPRLLLRAGLVAAVAYLVVSPWLPPSLLRTIRVNEAGTGEVDSSLRSWIALGLILFSCWAVWRVGSRHISEWSARWMLLFACPIILMPALAEFSGIHFLPQPGRYKEEAEMVFVWIAVFAMRPVLTRAPGWVRIAVAIPLLVLATRQLVGHRRFFKDLTRPVDITKSIEYRSAKWVESNLFGQRIMMSGSLGSFLNTFTNVPQLSAQPYTTAPNWVEQIAVYTIYIAQNTGERDAEYSLLWLKAFGAQAVAVPGPGSPEYWKPFTWPRKFDGMLPVLWRQDDTTIYRVPQPSAGLAHVVPRDSPVRRKPVHGLDVEEVRGFVAALDDPAAPPADLQWQGSRRAVIRATPPPGDVISIQINYHAGWSAHVGARECKLSEDGLGLMVAEPECTGACEITLEYNGGWEAKLCRAASAAVLLLLLVWSTIAYKRSRLSSRA